MRKPEEDDLEKPPTWAGRQFADHMEFIYRILLCLTLPPHSALPPDASKDICWSVFRDLKARLWWDIREEKKKESNAKLRSILHIRHTAMTYRCLWQSFNRIFMYYQLLILHKCPERLHSFRSNTQWPFWFRWSVRTLLSVRLLQVCKQHQTVFSGCLLGPSCAPWTCLYL